MVVKCEKSIGMEIGESIGKARSEKPVERRETKVETQIAAFCLRLYASWSARLPSRVHFQRGREPKAERRLGGKNDLLVAGKCRSACTCASAGGRANRSALAAAGQAADDCAERCAAACHHGSTLAFALQRAANG